MTMAAADSGAPRAGRVVSAVRFLSPAEVQHLATASGISQSSTAGRRQAQMLGLMQAIGGRAGFPQRTIATAQLLYQRFHLFYNARDFLAHEVASACIVVAGKMCDTPKKGRDIILHSWALRFPELTRAGPIPLTAQASTGQSSATLGSSSSLPGTSTSSPAQAAAPLALGLAHIPEASIDTAALEKEGKRVVSIESLLLQSIAFDFNTTVRDNLRYTIKISRDWQLDQNVAKLAWQIAADCHRTYAPLSYPPATIAVASIYTALLFSQKATYSCDHESCAKFLQQYFPESDPSVEPPSWQARFRTNLDDIEAVMHLLLDMYEAAAAQLASVSSAAITPISPATPASPSEMLGSADEHRNTVGGASASTQRKLPSHVTSPPPFGILFWNNEVAPALVDAGMPSDTVAGLTQIKIRLRQAEDKRRQDGRERPRPQAVFSVDGYPVAPAYGEAMMRHLDIGGVQGDVRAVRDADDSQEEVAGPDQQVRDKQLASLQRFLF